MTMQIARGWRDETELTTAHPGAETALLHVVAAMTAGATGTILTNPLWVVKTRFMVSARIWAIPCVAHKQAQATWPPSSAKYRNTFEAFTSIYRTEGFQAFYKGLVPSLMGVLHVAVQFPLYEKAKSWAGESKGAADASTAQQRLMNRPRRRPFFSSPFHHPRLQRLLEDGRFAHHLSSRGPPHTATNTQGERQPAFSGPSIYKDVRSEHPPHGLINRPTTTVSGRSHSLLSPRVRIEPA